MPLLADYAITPDVFDVTSYSSEEVCELHMQNLKDVLQCEGLVRDLRAGEWRALFARDHRPWHRRARELLKKLATQGRLVRFDPTLAAVPADDAEWCAEALRTHARIPFTGGVVVTEPVKAAFPDEALVARVDRLTSTSWWPARSESSSVSLTRSFAEYRKHLDAVLRCAKSLMFIDPHLDPARPGYQDLAQLIAAAGGRSPAPVIEIHRVCWKDAWDKRADPEFMEDLEASFRKALQGPMKRAGLRVEVFFWDDFHNRYLICNLIGISLPNGFDTTSNPKDIQHWTRLGRDGRDDTQREFDPASRRHALRHRFFLE